MAKQVDEVKTTRAPMVDYVISTANFSPRGGRRLSVRRRETAGRPRKRKGICSMSIDTERTHHRRRKKKKKKLLRITQRIDVCTYNSSDVTKEVVLVSPDNNDPRKSRQE